MNPANSKLLANVGQGSSADVDAAVKAARGALGDWRKLSGSWAGAPHLLSRARGAETFASARRARDDGQRKVDPRDARHRHPARRAALLSPRRLGAAPRERVSRLRRRRRRRPDHSVEFSAADVGVESRAGPGRGMHDRHEAGGVHAAHRALLRRDRQRRRTSAGRAEHRHRRRSHGRRARRSPGRRQDRVHGLDRSRTNHPQGDRRARARNSRSSWAERARSSSTRTRISTASSRASSTRSGSIRGRCAAPARDCWCRRASPID